MDSVRHYGKAVFRIQSNEILRSAEQRSVELDVDPEDLAAMPIEDEVVGFSACSAIDLCQLKSPVAQCGFVDFLEYALGDVSDNQLPKRLSDCLLYCVYERASFTAENRQDWIACRHQLLKPRGRRTAFRGFLADRTTGSNETNRLQQVQRLRGRFIAKLPPYQTIEVVAGLDHQTLV